MSLKTTASKSVGQAMWEVATDPQLHVFGGDLTLPEDVATQRLAFLGVSGSGKTYGAGRLAEELHRTKNQFAIIDTVGNWWGLRVGRDGASPGLSIPILGGLRGDVPLEPEHGELVADTLATTSSSMIIDVADFTEGERRKFLVAFAQQLLRNKMREPSPLMLIWEECHEVIPQQVFGEDARMVHAIIRLIKKGRNYGIGTTLISQRSAAVSKEALNQAHTLFVFRTIGKADRKAITDWTDDKVGDGDVSPKWPMSKLETGQCIVYSPDWMRVHQLAGVLPKATFDGTRAPDKRTVRRDLAPVDLEAFKRTMGEAMERAKENDPEVLRARIRELEAKLASVQKIDDVAIDDLVRGSNAATARVLELQNELAAARLENQRYATAWRATHDSIDRAIAALRGIGSEPGIVVAPPPVTPAVEPRTFFLNEKHELPPVRGSGTGEEMPAMQRRMLTVLAQRGALPKHKILVFAEYAASGNSSTAFAELHKRGWVEPHAGGLAITHAGRKALGQYVPLPTGDALYRSIMGGSRLSAMEKKFLAALHDAYPSSVPKSKVLSDTGYAASGNSSTAFATLVRLEYVESVGVSQLRASDELFDHPRRK